ncbi:DUF4362 domain-containing protein [Anaerobacillus sp. CMMVII]|uniref:DUF4362 domain-containing protein n=1 Tax=Anaerobacillus sp. CMMVII TaxID=2755588 RepID=UPI0021B79059|nr:DUF4362 domain-containing protein [Anaerobacillus sp. CMMVII]MCT8140300.1 DUF4362 domain-containing protein [Anaerobacillus sp. CMMVII]
MKKAPYIIFILVLLVLLSACNRQSGNGEPQSTEGTSEIYVKGLENVDVLNSHGSIEGLERMSSFYENVKNGVPSDLRIVHYTIEGAPIVTDVSYNGEFLEVKDDTTRDTYGSGAITSKNCKNLIEEVNPTNTSYIAVDCTGGLRGMQEILKINYNMSQQDLFEFVLKYGLNQENEINSHTLKKESSTQIIKDVKQEVYKRLVFANYLAEKDLITTCDTKDTINYFLKVHINGGEREFQWSACDQSMDGVKFTKLANYIIEQSEKKQHVQPITVQGYVLEKKENELLVGEDFTMLDYEWMKDEIKHIDFNNYIYDFAILIGVNTEEFNPGDKILATIEERISDNKPGRALVKEIKKLELK